MNAELLKTVLFNNANLKAYFRFESGALTTDSSGNSKTLTNNNTATETTGKFDGGVAFNGTNQSLTIAEDFGIGATNWTISVWAKPSSSSQVGGVVALGNGASNGVSIYQGNEAGSAGNEIDGHLHGLAWLPSGVDWTGTAFDHVVMTNDATTTRIYVNGVHKNSIAGSPGAPNDVFEIGKLASTEWAGSVDEVAVFSVALTADQIKELYEGRFLGEAWPNIAQQTYSKELASTSLAINTNLKAYYKFESGALTTDSSGNSHTLTNNGTIVNATGKYGDGADLELSSTQYFSHADHADFNPSGDFSIGGWIKLESVGGGVDRAIVHKGDGTSGAGSCLDFFVKDDATITGAYFVGGSDARATTTTTLATGTWYHVIFQRSGNNCYIYINGKLSAVSASLSGANNNEANEFRIGSFCNNTRHFDGVIDDFFFLNGSALSADQIDELYSIRGGLVAGYHLSNETDFSGNNYNLTNNNTATFGAGKFGNKATFNGSNQSLSINNSFGIDGGEISISAWINPTTVTSASDHLSYVSLFGNTTKTGYGLFVGTTGIGATRLRAGVAWDDGAQVAISAGVWVHAVLTYDGTNLKLYINGSLRDSRVASGSGSASATSKATLGCRADVDALTGQLATSLDEVLFFNRVLSSREIRQMYALGVGKYD